VEKYLETGGEIDTGCVCKVPERGTLCKQEQENRFSVVKKGPERTPQIRRKDDRRLPGSYRKNEAFRGGQELSCPRRGGGLLGRSSEVGEGVGHVGVWGSRGQDKKKERRRNLESRRSSAVKSR